MSSIPTLRLLIALAAITPCLGADTAVSEPAKAETEIKAAWENASLGLFNEANRAFAKLSGDEARLGEAVTLLLRQPKTDANVRRSTELLSALIKNSPDSPLAITSKYYLGRISQTHSTPNDPAAARAIFKELIASHPGHPYADLATVKLALIELYDQVPDATRRARFDEFAALAPQLKSPSARRDLSIELADTSQRFGYDPVLALDFLLAADQVGIARRIEQGNVWVRIGQLAQENGRPEIARDYYNKYLSTFIRDNRRRMIKERLAALPPATTRNQEASR
jgi:hypothetical protein